MADEKKEKPSEVEQLQAEILRVELETKTLQLEAAKQANAEFKEKERRRRENNKRRMAELEQGRQTQEALENDCRHRSGGSPDNILRGGRQGSFSTISRAIMPDGVTILLQCPRCRMRKFPPTEAEKKSNPKKYVADLERYNKLLSDSIEFGLEHAITRGPTFLFKNKEGVPIIPERV